MYTHVPTMYTCMHHCRAGFYYSCGRSSLIWGVKPLAMTATPSERVTYLARHKTVPVGYLEQRADFLYSCGRSSTIWETGPRVRRWSYPQVRPRTAALARAKQTHPDYRPCKQVSKSIFSLLASYLFLLVPDRYRLL